MDEVPEIVINDQKNTTKTWAQLVALGMLYKAAKGDPTMAREVIDRLEGRPAQVISGPDAGPIQINQTIKHITQEELTPALQALMGVGVISISSN